MSFAQRLSVFALIAMAPFAARAENCSSLSMLPLPSATVGTPYSTPLLDWTLGGMPPYSYSSAVLPFGLMTDSAGNITGTPTAPTSGTFTGSVTVTDSCSVPQTVTLPVFIQVFAQPLTVGTSTLPGGILGVPYSQPVQVTGGVPPYSFALFHSSLAGTGLSLDPGTGIVSGSPASTGPISFRVGVTDSAKPSPSQVFQAISLQIVSQLVISTAATLPAALPNQTYSLQLTTKPGTGAPGAAITWSTPPSLLPPGLTLDATGLLHGAPTAAGSFSFPIQASDGVSPATLNATLAVFGPVSINNTTLPNGTYQETYGPIPMSATGGSGTFVWSATGLPYGVTISAAGVIGGTPNAIGNFAPKVSVLDSVSGQTASQSYSMTIAFAPLSLSTPSLPSGTIKVVYSASLNSAIAGGEPPYQWSLQGGSLPPGISLSATGILSGTPTAAGSFSFTAQATDGAGGTISANLTLQINQPPVVITSTLPSGIEYVAYPPQILSASGGVGPYTFSVAPGQLPDGMTLVGGVLAGTPIVSGTFTPMITVTDSANTQTTPTLTLIIRQSSTDIVLSTTSLSFSLPAGATALPQSQSVTVYSSNANQIGFSQVSQAASGPDWLTVSSAGSTTACTSPTCTPGTLTVNLNAQASALAASATPYTATIDVTCLSLMCPGNTAQNTNATPQIVTVSLLVTASPALLTVTTPLLSFSATSASAAASSQPVLIQNTGGLPLTFSDVGCDASWCGVASSPASLAAGASGTITITADPTGLTAGYYRTTLDMASTGGSVSIPVTLLVAQASQLLLAPSGMQIDMTRGSVPGNPNGSFLVSVSGTAVLNWSAAILNAPAWLKLNTSGGTATGAAPSTVSFSVDPSVAPTLAAQPYYATIEVTAPDAVNSPLDFQIVLNVVNAPSLSDPQPGGLLFLVGAGATAPSQTVQLFAAWQASTSTTDGNSWLSVSPSTGAATGNTEVSVDVSSLTQGVYYGGVTYQFPDTVVRTVNVTLVVEPPIAAPSAVVGSLHGHATAGCTPSALAPAPTGLVNNFSAPASWPTPLSILLVDDCGHAVPQGQIVVSFTNGDPPLALGLANSSTGLYSGTWTPRNTGSQVALNARATAAGFPAAAIHLNGAVIPNVAPVLNPGGTLHVFNPQLGAALAPGTIVQIYGSGLASGNAAAATIPLPINLNGTQVIIGGIAAPLYFVSPGQINAQIPFGLQPNNEYEVIASANGALTTPVTIQLAPVTPGFLAFSNGGLVAQHADGTLITAASPALPGEYVVAYLAGMGDTTVPVQAGGPAPSSPLADASVSPVLTLNGIQVPVTFAGLTPGLVGLYQIDFKIPGDTPPGTLTVVLSQGTFPANTTTLPVQ